MNTIIEKIRSEIERRIKEREESYVDNNTLELKNQEDRDIIEILDTIQEQPVCEELETEALRSAGVLLSEHFEDEDDDAIRTTALRSWKGGVIHGASWQKEQMMKEAVEEDRLIIRDIIAYIRQCDESGGGVILLPEDKKKWFDWLERIKSKIVKSSENTSLSSDLMKRASEIYPNKEGDLCSLHSTLQRGGYIRGYQDCKEKMMKEAVEAIVSQCPGSNEIIFHNPNSVHSWEFPWKFSAKGLNKGDKVKLIIVKED